MTTLNEFVLCAKFKGELPTEYEVYDPAHWVLLARAMHAFGDDEDKREAAMLLVEEDAEPDDELAYKLLGKWREELFGAHAPFP